MLLRDFCHTKNIFLNKDGTFIERELFFDSVNRLCSFLETQTKLTDSVLIGDLTPFKFFSVFIACNIVGRNIVLLPNLAQGTLQSHASDYDLYFNNNLFTIATESISSNDYVSTKLNELQLVTVYTSGSQGIPTRVDKTFMNLLNECHSLNSLFVESEMFLSSIGPRHIYGLLFCGLWPLLTGKIISDFKIEYPEELNMIRGIENTKVSFVSSPAFLKRLADDDTMSLNFESVFSSGGPLSPQSAKNVKTIFGIYANEVYGSTETGGIATRTQQSNNTKWTSFPEVTLALVNGCLHVKSSFIKEGEFQTNDLVSLYDDGSFKLNGRSDRIFKIEEKRVSLDELEAVIKGYPEIDDVKCLVLDEGGREFVASIIVFKIDSIYKIQSKISNVKAIKKYLAQYFDNILLPKKYRFVDHLPYNDQSKLREIDLKKVFYGS